MGPHLYGSPGPKCDIHGEEASTIGVRFYMLPNGEVHVSEVFLPGPNARPSASLEPPWTMLAARRLQTTHKLTFSLLPVAAGDACVQCSPAPSSWYASLRQCS